MRVKLHGGTIGLSASKSNFDIQFDAGEKFSAGGILHGNIGRPSRHLPIRNNSLNAAVTESVILDDDRTIELFTRNMPERLICALIIDGQGAPFHGTGWLAGPKLVMTCGHNVHHSDFGGWAHQIEIVPGLSEDERPFGQVIATRFSSHDRWATDHDVNFDIGCLHLDTPLGDRLGWFTVKQVDAPETLVGQSIVCSGYPEYQGEFTRQRSGEGSVVATTATRIFHSVDTNDGESGGPLWLQESGGVPPTVVAIHTYEKIVLPGPPPQEANSATLIDSQMFALIAKWQTAS
jgi:glutamyl endopeptidase